MNLAIIDDNLLDLKIINHVITKEIEKYKIVYQGRTVKCAFKKGCSRI